MGTAPFISAGKTPSITPLVAIGEEATSPLTRLSGYFFIDNEYKYYHMRSNYLDIAISAFLSNDFG